jgi:hypothetical protein
MTWFDDVLKMSVVKRAISPSHVDSNLVEPNFSPSLRLKSRGIQYSSYFYLIGVNYDEQKRFFDLA